MAKTLYTFQANLEQLEKLQKNLKDANRELEKMKKSGTASKKALQEQADGAKELNKELDQNIKKTRGVVQNTNEVTRAGKNMVNVFQSAAIAIAAAFSVRAIAGGVRGMINVFREFEATMAGVRAISGATDEEFKALEESALELGRSTIFSASQVAKLQEEFARLGFTSQQIQAAQSATIDLAAATGEDLANASATAGSVIRAFGLEAEQAGRVVDIMAGSFTNSALNLERFTQSMKFAAPVARATGFTVEETTALLMKLADAGLTGSIAGNALKNIFLELGDSSSKLSKELGGPVKGMDELVENLIKLRDGGFGAAQASELLNKRATPAFLALMNSADGLEKVALDLALADGAARQMAAIRLDTLEGDIIILQSAMEGLGIALSDTFDKTFRTVVISLTNFFQSFAENERALAIFRTAVIAAAGAVAFFASRFALLKLGSLITSLGALRTGFTGLTTALTITDRFITALSRGGFAGLATSFTRVTKGASVATLATKGFGAALRAIPFVGAIAFATSLISRFTDMGSEIDDITFKQDRLNRAFNDGIDSIRDMNEGTEERVNALKNLAKQFPALLNNIDVELLSNRELQELQDELNASSITTAQTRIERQKVANEQAALNAKNTINQLKSFREEVLNLGLEDVGIFSLTTQEEIDGMTQDQYYNALVTDYQNFITQINSIGEKFEQDGNTWYENTGLTGEELEQTKKLLSAAQNELSDFFKEVSTTGQGFSGELSKSFLGTDLQFITDLTITEFGVAIQGLTKNLDFLDDTDFGDAGIKKLEDFKKDFDKQLIDIATSNKRFNEVRIEDGLTNRQRLRLGYLEELDDFRDFSRTKQEAEIKNLEDELDTRQQALEISKLYNTGQKEAGDAFIEVLGEQGVLIRQMLDNNFNPSEAIQEIQELRRHLSNLRSNLNSSNASMNKSSSNSQKFRLERTKDFYDDLRKLQTTFHRDEITREEQQSLAKLETTKRDLEQELALNRANITEIERIRGRIISGREASEFISSKNIIKNFEFLQRFTKGTIEDISKAYKNGNKEVTAEIVTIGENGEEVITTQVFTLQEILDEMIKEEQTKMQTNNDFMLALTEEFNRKMDLLRLDRAERDFEIESEYFELLLQREKTTRDFIEGNQAGIEGNNRFARQVDILQKTTEREIELLEDRKDKEVELIEKTRDEALKNENLTGVERVAIRRQAEIDIQNIEDKFRNDKLRKENDLSEKLKQNTLEQIQAIGDTYNAVFDLFSQLQSNALDVQLANAQTQHETQMRLFDDRMERELQLAGDNEEAKEAIRENFADKKEIADKQLAAKEREIAKKRFITDKVNAIIQATINGASAMVATAGKIGFPAILAAAPFVTALTAAQIAVIASQQFVGKKGGLIPEYGRGGMVHGPSHANGGVKFNAGGRVVELEGGEAVINKRSTDMFRSQLSAINVAGGGKKFQDGGITPGTGNMLASISGGMSTEVLADTIVSGINSKRVVVSESDISSSQNNVAVSEATSSLF